MRTTLLATVALLLAVANVAPAADQQPNIVFILADDLGWGETGCYGQKKIRTPNIDRLATQGTRFTRAYSGAPVCAPSRCVLMTGRNLAHAPIRGNKRHGEEGQLPLPAAYTTWATLVQRHAGYATCGIGKWGLGMPDNEGSPLRHGFVHFFGCLCQGKAHSYYPAHLWSDDHKVMLDNGPKGVPGHGKGDFAPFQGKDYAPDRMVAEAKLWLDQRAKDHKPFFLYLPFTEPHLALQPPQRILDTYPTAWDTKPYLGEKGYVPHPRPHAAYAAMITSLDEHVGHIMQWLDEHKMADNTLVIFTSDNGATHDVGGVDTEFFNSVGELRGRKGSLHEGGMRVPFIVRWPGHTPAGTTSDETVAFIDMLPTMCDVLGMAAPKCDGVSLRALFEGHSLAGPHPPIVSDFPEYGGQQSVIDGKWKLIRKDLTKAGSDHPTPWELYDLLVDRGETTDLAAKYPHEVKRLAAIFQSQWTPNSEFSMYPVRQKAR